jgi:uncharacterized protein
MYCGFCMLIVLLCVVSAVRADYAAGKDAYEMEDYISAMGHLLPLAEKGDTEAQILVGRMYNNGNGVTADLARGAGYYQRAASNGNARAQALLAFLYTAGRGVKRDHTLALHWYLQAANNGDPYAQLDVARIYRQGSHVEKDYVQAYKWYAIASNNEAICDCLLDGKGLVAAKMTRQEIQQAESLAGKWLQRQDR